MRLAFGRRRRERTAAAVERRAPHVGIIVQNLPVPLDRRVWNECQTLVAAGYRVSVICPRGPGQPTFQHLDGVDIHTYPPPPAGDGLGPFVRESVVSWVHTLVRAMRIHRRSPVDAWQACNPPDTYWTIGALFKLVGARFVFDHHDLCPEIYRSRFDRDGGFGLRLLLLLERMTYRVADHVIVTNESYRQVAIERGRRQRRDTTVVRSGPDPDRLRPGPPDPDLLRGHRHLAAYLGVMGHQDGVDVVVRAADVIVNRWGRDDIGFVLMGFGDCFEELQALTRELGLEDHVHFTGRVDLPEIRRYLCTATVGLSPDPRSPFNEVSTMNKTLEYLACALPVVAFDLRETRVSAGHAAWYAAGDDVESFAATTVALVDEPELRAQMGRAGRARIERRLGWPAQAPAYERVYRNLLGERAPVPVPEPVLVPQPVPTDVPEPVPSTVPAAAGDGDLVIDLRTAADAVATEPAPAPVRAGQAR